MDLTGFQVNFHITTFSAKIHKQAFLYLFIFCFTYTTMNSV